MIQCFAFGPVAGIKTSPAKRSCTRFCSAADLRVDTVKAYLFAIARNLRSLADLPTQFHRPRVAQDRPVRPEIVITGGTFDTATFTDAVATH